MDIEQAKAEAIRIAGAILDGGIELVAGCRAIQRPLRVLGLRMDEDFRIFVGVDSEADALPIGDEQRHWNAETLRLLEPQVSGFYAHYRPDVEDACRRLIARLG